MYQVNTTNYYYDRQHVILETDDKGNERTSYLRGINYISKRESASTSYYLYNGHGDVVQTVSKDGTIKNEYDYDIFGTPILTIENESNAIRYAGEFYDEETGLYYLRARYYDPYIGRFISEDSYWGEDVNPLSLNLYTYCFNDPIRYVDPTGHRTKMHVGLDYNEGNYYKYTQGRSFGYLYNASDMENKIDPHMDIDYEEKKRGDLVLI